MSTTEAPFSFTTKVDGDLLTVRGEDFAAFAANLGSLLNVPAVSRLVAVLNGEHPITEQHAVANIQQALGGTVVSAPVPVAPVVAPVQPQFAPVQPPVQPSTVPSQAPSCQHGAMKLIPGGISKKTGKPYNAFWACQWPNRDEQCQAVFPN